MADRVGRIVLALPLLAVLSMAALPRLWTRRDPRDCDLALGARPPDAAHVFGTNALGCDYYAMTVHGARPAVLVGLCAAVAAVVVGGLAGTVAGYRGGWVDSAVSRTADVFAALPALLGVLVLLTLLRAHSVVAVVGALALLGWPPVARIARGATIAARRSGHADAARALGASHPHVVLRHVLPDALPPVVAVGSTSLGGYLAAESTLSYLGVGLRPPAVSWGVLVNQSRDLAEHPHLLLFPGGFLLVTVVCLVLLGDVAGDALDRRG
ncbi:ABC transporter permease, partial [Saccharothrix syringae]|uniref:ABC transporter permease n=1 Tax=Saccharothrix syringae TaxID=103733 RepID=A0A5Q0H2K1_SACSY